MTANQFGAEVTMTLRRDHHACPRTTDVYLLSASCVRIADEHGTYP